MLERTLYQRMKRWKKEDATGTALLIEGARRVGKSTLVRQFAAKEYRSHIFIDFNEAAPEVFDLFTQYRADLDTLFMHLSTYYDTRLYPGESLIVFDEVQLCPQARSLIKYLVADGRYHYIETGSLISIRKNVENIVIPSEEERIRLDPLSFPEFLRAQDLEMLLEALRKSFSERTALPGALHRKASEAMTNYLLVGGMPQAVLSFLEERDLGRVERVKRRILDLYRSDVERYAGTEQGRIESIIDEIPGQLTRGSGRFNLSQLSPQARMRDFGEAFYWLNQAHISSLCYAASEPSLSLKLARQGSFKCYMADTGLLIRLAIDTKLEGHQDIYKLLLSGKSGINRGMFLENLIAQTLHANGYKLYYYRERDRGDGRGQNMEIDFLITRPYENAAGKTRVSPIEVKSSNRYTTTSLERFRSSYGKNVGTAIVIHPGPLQAEGDILKIPPYLAHLL